VWNVDSTVKDIESKIHIVNSHSQSIAKLEAQLRQLAIAISKREEGKLPSHPLQNTKGAIIWIIESYNGSKGGKEVDKKVTEKEHDKEERLKSMESGLESGKENDLCPSPIYCIWSYYDI